MSSTGHVDSTGYSINPDTWMTDHGFDSETHGSSDNSSAGSSHQTSYGSSNSHAVGHGEGQAIQKGKSTGDTWSRTVSQALKGRAETRKVLQSVNFKTSDEQLIETVNHVEMQRTGEAVVIVKGVGIVRAQVPEVKLSFPKLQNTLSRYVNEFMKSQLSLPWFSDANEAYRQRLEFEASISAHLQSLIKEKNERVNPRLEGPSSTLTFPGQAVELPSIPKDESPEMPTTKSKPTKSQHDPEEYDGDF
jgi:hypothetical protein